MPCSVLVVHVGQSSGEIILRFIIPVVVTPDKVHTKYSTSVSTALKRLLGTTIVYSTVDKDLIIIEG